MKMYPMPSNDTAEGKRYGSNHCIAAPFIPTVSVIHSAWICFKINVIPFTLFSWLYSITHSDDRLWVKTVQKPSGVCFSCPALPDSTLLHPSTFDSHELFRILSTLSTGSLYSLYISISSLSHTNLLPLSLHVSVSISGFAVQCFELVHPVYVS